MSQRVGERRGGRRKGVIGLGNEMTRATGRVFICTVRGRTAHVDPEGSQGRTPQGRGERRKHERRVSGVGRRESGLGRRLSTQ
jgi:hypothetical protein